MLLPIIYLIMLTYLILETVFWMFYLASQRVIPQPRDREYCSEYDR